MVTAEQLDKLQARLQAKLGTHIKVGAWYSGTFLCGGPLIYDEATGTYPDKEPRFSLRVPEPSSAEEWMDLEQRVIIAFRALRGA